MGDKAKDESMIRVDLDVLDKLRTEAAAEGRSMRMQLDYILRQHYGLSKQAFDASEAARQIKEGTEQEVTPANGENGQQQNSGKA